MLKLEESFYQVSPKGGFTNSALTTPWDLASDGAMNFLIAEQFSSGLPMMDNSGLFLGVALKTSFRKKFEVCRKSDISRFWCLVCGKLTWKCHRLPPISFVEEKKK